jgi:glycosyltransferase involved in cell wall biosynthesis
VKIAIIDYTGTKKYPGMELKQGIGASDRAVLELCKNLPLMNHEVHFFSNSTYQGNFDGTIWHTCVEDGFVCDVVIMQRSIIYQEKIKYKKMFLWMHDDIDAPVNKNYSIFKDIPDEIIVSSEYHKERLIECGTDESKINIVPLGVEKNNFVGCDYLRSQNCIYASAPFKGLPLLIKLWSRIHERVPKAFLHICSGMNLYNAPDQDKYFKVIYDAIEKDPSIMNHGVKTNKQVSRIMGQSALMVYPNFFPETFCVAAIESIYQETPIVTSAIGALPETVGDCGVCISGDPKSEEYQNNFVETVVNLLEDKEKRERLKTKCKERYLMSWGEVIEAINELMEETIYDFLPN